MNLGKLLNLLNYFSQLLILLLIFAIDIMTNVLITNWIIFENIFIFYLIKTIIKSIKSLNKMLLHTLMF
jgi:hypothetical protein